MPAGASLTPGLLTRPETEKERKPAFFAGGIPRQLGVLEEWVALVEALDPSAGPAARTRLDEARVELTRRRAALRDAIVEANERPADAYKGDDRAAVEEAAVAAWKKLEPGATVLGARIHAEAWRRETLLRKQNSEWYVVDRSRLQVLLLVKLDDRLAAVRPIDLWIDHQAGDARTAIPLHDPKDPVDPQYLLLAAKIR